MSQLWNIVGQACSDDAFRQEVFAQVRYGDLALKNHRSLHDFFGQLTPWCLTRWELLEVNRIFSLVADDQGPMASIAKAWDPAPRQDEVLATFGLACFDVQIRDAIENGTVEEAQAALAEGPPQIRLTLGQVDALRDLLARNAQGKTVRQRMEQLEATAWIPTQHWEPFCEPGATFSTGYYHPNPRLIHALQLVDPIREYLSSEPPERDDPEAVQTKIRHMLDAHLGGT